MCGLGFGGRIAAGRIRAGSEGRVGERRRNCRWVGGPECESLEAMVVCLEKELPTS